MESISGIANSVPQGKSSPYFKNQFWLFTISDVWLCLDIYFPNVDAFGLSILMQLFSSLIGRGFSNLILTATEYKQNKEKTLIELFLSLMPYVSLCDSTGAIITVVI